MRRGRSRKFRQADVTERLGKLNTLMKLFEVEGLAVHDRGNPGNGTQAWKHTPYRVIVQRVMGLDAAGGRWGGQPYYYATAMFETLDELEAHVHGCCKSPDDH